MKLIESLTEKIISSHSFDYASFADAEATIHFALGGEQKFYRYDRLSLWKYDHSLTPEMYCELGRLLSKKWEECADSEEKKERIEYGTLLLYTEIHPDLKHANIEKCNQPDFCLTLGDGRRIGIEVTRFTRADEEITGAIVKEYASSTLSVVEIKKEVEDKHGEKAKGCSIGILDDKTLFCGASMSPISTEPFVNLVNKKVKIYADKVKQFDDFIILVNARDGITLTSSEEVEWFFNEFFEKQTKTIDATLAVMYYDSSLETRACEERRI